MDISDRIESRDSLVIPERLVFVLDDWISELFRRALDAGDEVEGRAAAIKVVHLYDAFVAGSLTPAQLAELTQSAAHWMEPRWPNDPCDADSVARLLEVSRELLELRDRTRAIASKNDNISRVLTVAPEWRGLLRCKTLAVLEFHHHLLEDARDLAPAELLGAASVLRDAIAVLDTIGWVAGEQDAAELIAPAILVVQARHQLDEAFTLKAVKDLQRSRRRNRQGLVGARAGRGLGRSLRPARGAPRRRRAVDPRQPDRSRRGDRPRRDRPHRPAHPRRAPGRRWSLADPARPVRPTTRVAPSTAGACALSAYATARDDLRLRRHGTDPEVARRG